MGLWTWAQVGKDSGQPLWPSAKGPSHPEQMDDPASSRTRARVSQD